MILTGLSANSVYSMCWHVQVLAMASNNNCVLTAMLHNPVNDIASAAAALVALCLCCGYHGCERERERSNSHPSSRPSWAYWMKQPTLPTSNLKCLGCQRTFLVQYTHQAQFKVHQMNTLQAINCGSLPLSRLKSFANQQTPQCTQRCWPKKFATI